MSSAVLDDPKNSSAKKLNLNEKTSSVFIQNIDDPKNSWAQKLNLDDDLSKIRKDLKIENTTLFSKKIRYNLYFYIKFDDEKSYRLSDIIGDHNILYLKMPDWNDLQLKLKLGQLKLGHGRTINSDGIKIANKEAFTIKDNKMSKIG